MPRSSSSSGMALAKWVSYAERPMSLLPVGLALALWMLKHKVVRTYGLATMCAGLKRPWLQQMWLALMWSGDQTLSTAPHPKPVCYRYASMKHFSKSSITLAVTSVERQPNDCSML